MNGFAKPIISITLLLGLAYAGFGQSAPPTPAPINTPPIVYVSVDPSGPCVMNNQGSAPFFLTVNQTTGVVFRCSNGTWVNTLSGTSNFTGPVTTSNFNGIRIIDGVKFAKSAAGINAADADIGANIPGEVWVYGVTATDTQIAMTTGHVLRVFSALVIDAVNKGPILLGNGAKMVCMPPSPDNNAMILNVGSGSFPSMIRLTTQDGSQTNNAIEGCSFYGNVNGATNGVIDATGMTQRAWIRDNKIWGFNAGAGIFIQDNQTGALAGTNNVEILNNQISASGTGTCINITHSATNAVVLSQFYIQDINCSAGASSTSSVLIQNPVASGAANLRQVSIQNLFVTGTPAAQSSLVINGVQYASAKNVTCIGGSPTNCVNISSNANNLALSFDNIQCNSGCTNVFTDVANSYTNSNNYINHYGFTASIAGYSGNNILAGTTVTSNFNQIRIVDGIRFPLSAAGINAADADLDGAGGEVWTPPGGITATDAQISIRANHTLRILGQLTIDALNRGPILLQGTARIVCIGNFGFANILNTSAQTNIPSMVRLTTQDGSLGGMEIDGCRIEANGSTVTNGVIDASGAVNGPSWIKDNLIAGFASGWGIFIQDIQSGALGGTNAVQIMNNRIVASGTGACIDIFHSATNAVIIKNITIQDTNCTPGGTTSPVVLLQNTSNDGSRVETVNISNLQMIGASGAIGLQVNGVRSGTFRQVNCTLGSVTNCIQITSNGNNQGLAFDAAFTDSGNPVLNDVANSFAIANAYAAHYDFPIPGTFGGSYNTVYKMTAANLNNIRLIDGVKFAKSAAGINAADADLNTPGEIWVPPGVIATDAQISIGSNHVLKIFGQLTIEANSTKGPILLGNGARLTCAYAFPNAISGNIIENTNATTLASMVRLTTQDGSFVGNSIDGCSFFGNNSSVTNGIIDATGMTSHSAVRDNTITSFASGWGIFIQDIQSGALAGTTNVQISNNQISANSTGGCIDITHGATNAVLLLNINIEDTSCSAGPSITTAPILVSNSSAGQNIREISLSNLLVNGIPGGQPGINLFGVFQAAVKHIACYSPGSGSAGCVNMPGNAQTGNVTIENIVTFPASNANTVVDSTTAITATGALLGRYDTNVQFLGSVGYLKVNGPAPAIAVTGFGTGPSVTLNPNSTNHAGIIQGTTGTAPASSGTFTLTFNTSQTASFGANFPACVVSLSGGWNARATLFINSTTNTQAVFGWDNNGVNLAASTSSFNAHYWCSAR